ncbi:gfo/Idh/MocA family oxidoreductase [Leptospira semungkisensis]|uniref:Gfo/Idh/MocA family oxidoreductase n=1 Tax=Leptospira semungkisensis TaxID=2484985 RepID=A0A4R9G8B1_9LEPT|nr:Gfo/Idh/MocA family oxidoreductase [Leptospira semungkisensis]TGK07888.1 gfo/Idh/MocA family oxidoreductase [Leptospira semungkisensis]
MRKSTVVLIGLGRIASSLEKDPYRNKPCTHAGVLFSGWGKKNFQFIGGIEPNADKRDSFSKQWKLSPELLHEDWEDWKKFKQIPDLAIISSPSESHYRNALDCIEFGIQNLLIEKPVCETFVQAKDLDKFARKKGVRIWVNHERRYHPKYAWAKSVIESGKYGEVRTIRASVLTSALAPGRAYKGRTGPLFHDGTHAVDLIYWLLGKPDRVRSSLTRRKGIPVEDRAVAFLEYKSGPIVFLEAGGARDYFQFEMDIMTEKARILLSNDGMKLFESRPSRIYKGFNSLTEVSFPEKSFLGSNPFENLYSSIRKVLTGKSESMTGDISENLNIMELLHRIKTKAEIQTVSEI